MSLHKTGFVPSMVKTTETTIEVAGTVNLSGIIAKLSEIEFIASGTPNGAGLATILADVAFIRSNLTTTHTENVTNFDVRPMHSKPPKPKRDFFGKVITP